jgi:hypothetical protein
MQLSYNLNEQPQCCIDFARWLRKSILEYISALFFVASYQLIHIIKLEIELCCCSIVNYSSQ